MRYHNRHYYREHLVRRPPASARGTMTWDNWKRMPSRLLLAMAAYAVLALAAALTLDGVLRAAVWIAMAGLAVKTWIAYKAGW